MNREPFARFLKLLAPDPEEAGRRYDLLHKKLASFLSMNGISDPLSAADETLDRAVLKIDAGAVVPDAEKFCFGIARNIVKERHRLIKREVSAFRAFIEDINNSSSEHVERIYGIMKPCFDQLAVKDQQLLLAYCQEIQGRSRAEHRRELAKAMNITVLALRLRVTRLRSILTDCARKRANKV